MKRSLLVALVVALAAILAATCHASPTQMPAGAAQQIGSAAAGVPPQPVQYFGKEYIPWVFHEMLYFNKQEADLEHHAFVRGAYMFVSLTDLCRHIGGYLTWGPRESFVQVERRGKVVRFYPGSSRIAVDGNVEYLSRSTFRINHELFVPVRSVCDVFGCTTDWDPGTRRAYVSFPVE